MAFKFRDLIVTLIPQHVRGGLAGDCDSTSGGCGGTCDAGSQSTVGSCTSEGCGRQGVLLNCQLSDEFLDPLKGIIDPPYLIELRLLLRHAIARSMAAKTAALEAQMVPRTVAEADELEKNLTDALSDLRRIRTGLKDK